MPRPTPLTPTPYTPAPLSLPLAHAPSLGVQQHLAACERGHKATETTEHVSIRADERLGLSAISAGFNAVGSSVLMQEPRDNGERVVREAPEAPATAATEATHLLTEANEAPEQASMREPQTTRAERVSGAAQELDLAEDQLINFADTGAALGVFLCVFFLSVNPSSWTACRSSCRYVRVRILRYVCPSVMKKCSTLLYALNTLT